jgi:hypothetical protein
MAILPAACHFMRRINLTPARPVCRSPASKAGRVRQSPTLTAVEKHQLLRMIYLMFNKPARWQVIASNAKAYAAMR